MKSYQFKAKALWQILNIFTTIIIANSVKNHKSPMIIAGVGLLAIIFNLIWIKKEKDNWTRGYKIAMGVYIVVLILFTIGMVRMSM